MLFTKVYGYDTCTLKTLFPEQKVTFLTREKLINAAVCAHYKHQAELLKIYTLSNTKLSRKKLE